MFVVICGAVPSMVRSVRLYNDCSGSQVRVDLRGRVLADDVDIPDRFSKYTQYVCSHMWPSPRRRCGYT
ncbi:hypothetical protein J6590_029468 [Homalodisca vitripennis]|nr:hypothetical protein J6590_029468 [Homalodisca vitripennis]